MCNLKYFYMKISLLWFVCFSPQHHRDGFHGNLSDFHLLHSQRPLCQTQELLVSWRWEQLVIVTNDCNKFLLTRIGSYEVHLLNYCIEGELGLQYITKEILNSLLVWTYFLPGTLMSGLSLLFLMSVMNMFFGSLLLFKVLTHAKHLTSCASLRADFNMPFVWPIGTHVPGAAHHVRLRPVWHSAYHWESGERRQGLRLVRTCVTVHEQTPPGPLSVGSHLLINKCHANTKLPYSVPLCMFHIHIPEINTSITHVICFLKALCGLVPWLHHHLQETDGHPRHER